MGVAADPCRGLLDQPIQIRRETGVQRVALKSAANRFEGWHVMRYDDCLAFKILKG